VLDNDHLRLRRLGGRYLNDRRLLDRTRTPTSHDRFDHLLADTGLLELCKRRRVDAEHTPIYLDQRQEHLVSKTSTLEVDDVLERDRLRGRHAQRDDDGGGSEQAANHAKSPVELVRLFQQGTGCNCSTRPQQP